MSRPALHSTHDIVTVFARQGIALATIARAMALPVDRVLGMCQRARQDGELAMIPPTEPNDPRHVLVCEVTNLRAQLDDAQEEIRSLIDRKETVAEAIMGIAGFTRAEAKVLTAISRGRATKSNIYHVLYGGEDVDRDPKIVDVLVCKIRKKLKPLGIQIGTLWGTGYTMDESSRSKLANLAGLATLDTVKVPRLDSPGLAPTLDEMRGVA